MYLVIIELTMTQKQAMYRGDTVYNVYTCINNLLSMCVLYSTVINDNFCLSRFELKANKLKLFQLQLVDVLSKLLIVIFS